MSNVIKHADASRVQVRLDYRDQDQLVLSVVDDGRGFDYANIANGQGLVAMSDYAQAIGGKAEITSRAGHGTTVSVSLALPKSMPTVPVGQANLAMEM